ncbi:MAG: hypothetical protein COA44_10320 [Arcobacter sp.]|nr:MAG: hypothetical protein COA44_10320 [Arcobacter sp.]
MDAKELKEITSQLSLLYVEDDHDLRAETLKLFSHLFKTTQSAVNGKLALEILEQNTYDLIITDINMPIMDGVTLSKKIKERFPTQSIIITSAHDQSSYLLELIDLGIDKFILKPFDMQKLLRTLTDVCTHIQNEKLIKKYKLEIETSNRKLTQKNVELESLVKILDNKIIQLNTNNKLINKIAQKSPKDAINTISTKPPQAKRTLIKDSNDMYIYNEYMVNNDLLELSTLEKDIAAISALFNLQESITEEAVLHLARNLSLYSKILNNYALFKKLSIEISTLADVIQKNPKSFIQNCCNIYILLESFIYVLKRWRLSLFVKGVRDPNIYDISMINDIKTIIIILQDNEGENSVELEFF